VGPVHFSSGLLVVDGQATGGTGSVITIAIFIIGLFVSGITLTAAMFVGIQEASDPALSRVADLTELEKRIVDR
jgi:hypothetical protein